MEIWGHGVIPLTRTDEKFFTPREFEQKAAELAYFLCVPIVVFGVPIAIFCNCKGIFEYLSKVKEGTNKDKRKLLRICFVQVRYMEFYSSIFI
jgi:hypothetical protein